MNSFYLKVTTPSKTCIEKTIYQASFVTSDGIIGILAHHTPIIGSVIPGYFKIITSETQQLALINYGVYKFENNTLTITTDFFEFTDKINQNVIDVRNEIINQAISKMKLDSDIAKSIKKFVNKITKIWFNNSSKHK